MEGFAHSIATIEPDIDGVILGALEHPAINRATRQLRSRKIPIVCLTSDLASARRHAYIGNNQYAACETAALLIGDTLRHKGPTHRNTVMLVASAAYRCQQEREMGFRHIIRNEFPNLKIKARIISDETPEETYSKVFDHFSRHGTPDAIYNVAGGKRAIARAIENRTDETRPVFIAHELTEHTRSLLKNRVLNYVISHNIIEELTASCQWITDHLAGRKGNSSNTNILLHTRYNCDDSR